MYCAYSRLGRFMCTSSASCVEVKTAVAIFWGGVVTSIFKIKYKWGSKRSIPAVDLLMNYHTIYLPIYRYLRVEKMSTPKEPIYFALCVLNISKSWSIRFRGVVNCEPVTGVRKFQKRHHDGVGGMVIYELVSFYSPRTSAILYNININGKLVQSNIQYFDITEKVDSSKEVLAP